jgi:hypothetical protein
MQRRNSGMAGVMMKRIIAVLTAGMLVAGVALAESCTTQSAMTGTDRDALAAVARSLAAKVQANDVSGLRAMTVPEYAKDPGAMENVVGGTAAKIKDGAVKVEQVYLLDGTDLKRGADGAALDAQFFCSLNHTIAEADFLIPGLPPGRYGFAIVDVQGASPWRLSFLVREEQGKWLMAGFYPKTLTAAGHDGLWYWTQARTMATHKEQWNAWLYYQQAESLLRPTNFVQSTHLEKLKSEQSGAAPPAVSGGVTQEEPLVVKGTDGVEYRFTGLGVDDSLGKEKIDVIVHLKVDQQLGDPVAANKRNAAAMSALVAAYPELRKSFHGVWVFAEVSGQNPFASEQAMNEIH